MKNILGLLAFLISFNSSFAQNTTSMKDWQYPYKVKTVLLKDSSAIAYVEEGTGEHTLLFVHGLGSYLKAWQKNIDELQKNYRCIALDLPGYGKSIDAVGNQSMAFFSDVLIDFIQQLELEKVVLVGHSMGGQIAIHTALKNSSLLEKLVLVAPAGLEQFTEKDHIFFKTFITPSIIKATPVVQIEKNFHLNFYDMPEDAQFMIDDRLQMRETKEYDRYCEMIPKCVIGMLEAPVFERLSEITLPTLLFFGKEDALIPNKYLHPELTVEKVAKSGAEEFKNAQLYFIDKAGHFVQWEGSTEVNEGIRLFVSQ
ncbi:MAG: alpha/beta fold hydrolase [Bacteroidota bacterium]